MNDNETLSSLWQKSFPGLATAAADPSLSYRSDSLSSTATVALKTPASSASEASNRAAKTEPPGHRLLARIGEGGMGLVYRARQLSLQREVAVKTFKRGPGDASARQAFLAEARVTAALDHPNIVPVHELHEQGEELYLSMKLVGGKPWSERLREDKPWQDASKLDEHLEILLSVGNALAFAHSRSIVHLDLKPDNVMLGEYGEVLVLDWGLARELGEGEGRAPKAADLKEPCGTPRYMAPELARGKGALVGAWTDVFLLGACLYEVLTGRPPHKGSGLFEVLAAAVGEEVAAPQGAPRELAELVSQALSREAEGRPSSVEEFQGALRDYRRHRESARLSEEAWRGLEGEGAGRERYDALAASIASFDQSLKLWGGNKSALEGRSSARRAYAEAALSGGDLLLAETQISALELGPRREELEGRLGAAKAAEAARLRRSRWQRRGLVGAALAIAALTGFAFEINRRGRLAEEAEKLKARAAEARALASAAEVSIQAEKVQKARVEAEASALAAKANAAEARAALAQAERNLTEAYRQAGTHQLSGKEMSLADVYLSRALVSEDSRSTREALLEARLAAPRKLWSRSFPARDIQAISDAEDGRLAVSWSESKGAGKASRVEVYDFEAGGFLGAVARVSSRAAPLLSFDPTSVKRLVLAGPTTIEFWDYTRGRLVRPYDVQSYKPIAPASGLVDCKRAGQILWLNASDDVCSMDPKRGVLRQMSSTRTGGRARTFKVHSLFAPARFAGVFLVGEGVNDRVHLGAMKGKIFSAPSAEDTMPLKARKLVSASADGERFAIAYHSRVRFWKTGEDEEKEGLGYFLISENEDAQLLNRSFSKEWVRGLSMSPDGRFVLAYRSDDPALRIWSEDRLQLVLRISGRGRVLERAAFGRSGSCFFALWKRGDGLADLEVWSLGPRAVSSPRGTSTAVALEPVAGTGELLALYKNELVRWNPELNRWRSVAGLVEAGALAVSPEGDRIAVSEGDGLTVRDALSGTLLRRLPQEYEQYADLPVGVPKAYLEQRNALILDLLSAGMGEHPLKSEALKVFARLLERGEGLERGLPELGELGEKLRSTLGVIDRAMKRSVKRWFRYRALAFESGGAKLRAFGVGETHLFAIDSGTIEARRKEELIDFQANRGLHYAVDPEGERFAVLRREKAIELRAKEGGFEDNRSTTKRWPGGLVIRDRSGAVVGASDVSDSLGRGLAFSPEGKRIAFLDNRSVLTLWSDRGEEQRAVRLLTEDPRTGHASRVTSFDFLTAELIASADESGRACVWRLADGALIGSFRAFPGAVRNLRVSPDGAYLFAANIHGRVRRWDARIIARVLTATPEQLFEDARRRTGLRLEGLAVVPASQDK